MRDDTKFLLAFFVELADIVQKALEGTFDGSCNLKDMNFTIFLDADWFDFEFGSDAGDNLRDTACLDERIELLDDEDNVSIRTFID